MYNSSKCKYKNYQCNIKSSANIVHYSAGILQLLDGLHIAEWYNATSVASRTYEPLFVNLILDNQNVVLVECELICVISNVIVECLNFPVNVHACACESARITV